MHGHDMKKVVPEIIKGCLGKSPAKLTLPPKVSDHNFFPYLEFMLF